MTENSKGAIFLKMFLYTGVTMIITFFGLLDTLKVDSFDKITSMDWFKLLGQSSLPSLIALKAFLDQSINNGKTENNQ
jgi:hypothetical protein